MLLSVEPGFGQELYFLFENLSRKSKHCQRPRVLSLKLQLPWVVPRLAIQLLEYPIPLSVLVRHKNLCAIDPSVDVVCNGSRFAGGWAKLTGEQLLSDSRGCQLPS